MEERFRQVSRILRQGVEQMCFPGAVLVVGCQGQLVYEEAVGAAALIPRARPMTLDTVFDLASLTKPIATTTALMLLLEASQVRLDASVDAYLNIRVENAAHPPTLRQLLCHSSGLPAWRPYYSTVDMTQPLADRRRAVYAAAHREIATASPGATVQYSDIGFMLLGEAVEMVSGLPLDVFCRQRIIAPLQLDCMGFRNLAQPPPPGEPIASTERCPWRGRVLTGEVHDENAWSMGGVAGHAGLFATGRQVWRFAQGLLDGLRGRTWLVSSATLRAFTTPQGSTWALGWDTPTPGQSSAGQYVSPTAIGHLGFTGTSLWIDPAQQVIVVLLTNRVHPSRQRQGIKTFRPLIHDAVMQALNLGSKIEG